MATLSAVQTLWVWLTGSICVGLNLKFCKFDTHTPHYITLLNILGNNKKQNMSLAWCVQQSLILSLWDDYLYCFLIRGKLSLSAPSYYLLVFVCVICFQAIKLFRRARSHNVLLRFWEDCTAARIHTFSHYTYCCVSQRRCFRVLSQKCNAGSTYWGCAVLQFFSMKGEKSIAGCEQRTPQTQTEHTIKS